MFPTAPINGAVIFMTGLATGILILMILVMAQDALFKEKIEKKRKITK